MSIWQRIVNRKQEPASELTSIEELLRAKAAIEEELKRFQQFRCIMFTDIKGSTDYFSKKGDKAGRTMIQKHNDLLFPIIEQHHGKIIKTIGDAIMAAFEDVNTVNFSATQDCYVTLLNIGTSGKLTIIFPNAYVQDNFIRAHDTYTFPNQDYPFDFRLTGPLGTEQIKAIATRTPSQFIETDFSPQGDVLREKATTRDIVIVGKQGDTSRLQEWAEDLCTFEVKGQ